MPLYMHTHVHVHVHKYIWMDISQTIYKGTCTMYMYVGGHFFESVLVEDGQIISRGHFFSLDYNYGTLDYF